MRIFAQKPEVRWHTRGIFQSCTDDTVTSRRSSDLENNQAVYINTFAEGARIGEPEMLTEKQLPMVVRSWKRSQAIVHYRLSGVDFIKNGDIKKEFLVGDIGVAKTMLPLDPEFTGLDHEQALGRLLNYWISAVVEDFDFQDEANPVLILNRKKALERLRAINVHRVQVGGQAYAVIQADIGNAYICDVAGYSAALPKPLYDWDAGKSAHVGEGFQVKVVQNENERIIVSRRELLPNPFERMDHRVRTGMRVRAHITHITQGAYKAEIYPGVRVSITNPKMFKILHVGDDVMVEVRGKNKQEFFGVVV